MYVSLLARVQANVQREDCPRCTLSIAVCCLVPNLPVCFPLPIARLPVCLAQVDVEKARVAFLKEQIAASKDYLHKETVEEDQLLVELQTQNADLQEQLLRKSHNATTSKDGDTSSLARSLPATLTSSVPLMHHTPNKIKRRLTIDEAISAATTKALDKHPDAIIRPTQTKSHGNFRTFLINGESVLMTQKGNRVCHRCFLCLSQCHVDMWVRH